METPDIEREIASYTGKLLRERFGKGPETVFTVMKKPFIIIHLQNFLTPMENIIMEEENEEEIQDLRENVMNRTLPSIVEHIQEKAQQRLGSFYYDFNIDHQTGIFVGVNKDIDDKERSSSSFVGQKKLEEKISEFSTESAGTPKIVSSQMLTKKMILVVREGVLTEVDKELIRLGYDKELKRAKRQVEKRTLWEHRSFQSVAGQKVKDYFVDWDFENNRSIIVFILGK
ncbi:Na-translocating system protein MpsC family protein [Marinococcus halotolerans]|uniref:Na-translocating system protein MpsC family protein n=1 Tax=Marinococcus halotolerans TaxID=301092 RepID=UPI0003B2F2A0|nr:Na-translocating system protein MpsC family protein [Marinococcus halotolerans]